MFWIIKFNYKRLIRYWYWIVIEIGYIWFMILSLIISEDVVNNTLFLPFNFINLSNFCLLWIFSLFLFLDYKSGMWNYIISSKIKKNNIVISYLFSGIILAILNTLFFFITGLIFVKEFNNYGLLNFINDFLINRIICILFFSVIFYFIFRLTPLNKDLSIFFLVIIILFFYFFAPLLYFVNENNNILNIVLLLIPIVNLSFNSGTNNYWIAMVINLIIILSFYFWILISLAKTKKINKQLNHFKGKINKKLSSFELNIENFEILTGDIIGIMGSNGSGKTTFINTLIDSFPKKREVNNLRLENYSYLKQTNNLGNLKLNNIVELISKLTKSKVDIEKLYLEYDLLTLKDHYFSKLSPGQQQRFKLLLLDLYDTQVLILDEVFNFVDINWKDKIIKKLNRFKDDNKTMLIIDHDFDNLKLVCNKLIILKEGKIIYKEKIKNIENKNQIEKFIR